MRNLRKINCPQCGSKVTIPTFWIIGIEGIFRCKKCKLKFKTGYKMGVVLSAVALSLSMAILQLAVFIFSIYSMTILALFLIPLWIALSFVMRRWYMLRKTKRFITFAKNPNQ